MTYRTYLALFIVYQATNCFCSMLFVTGQSRDALFRCIQVVGRDTVKATLKALSGAQKSYPFTFDRVFGDKTTQGEVFNAVSSAIMQDFFKGFNATVFAYGQTGSGKTWSMMGERNDPTNKGLIPRLVAMLFEHIEKTYDDDPTNYEESIFEVEVCIQPPTQASDKPLFLLISPVVPMSISGVCCMNSCCVRDRWVTSKSTWRESKTCWT